jgi:hypothetical protein
MPLAFMHRGSSAADKHCTRVSARARTHTQHTMTHVVELTLLVYAPTLQPVQLAAPIDANVSYLTRARALAYDNAHNTTRAFGHPTQLVWPCTGCCEPAAHCEHDSYTQCTHSHTRSHVHRTHLTANGTVRSPRAHRAVRLTRLCKVAGLTRRALCMHAYTRRINTRTQCGRHARIPVLQVAPPDRRCTQRMAW